MALTKTYTKTPCSLDSLMQSIQQDSNITIALDFSATSLLGNQLTVGFKADLADWTEVDSVVAAHNGVPLPQNVAQPVLIQSQPPVMVTSSPSFTSKTIIAQDGTIKKLYARTTGFKSSLIAGANTITYKSTFPWAKITGVEITNCEALDTVNLKVFDSADGTYSHVPNYLLNQFGFDVNMPKDFYSRVSQFDADIYQGMVLTIEYTSVSAKTIGINLVINEVK